MAVRHGERPRVGLRIPVHQVFANRLCMSFHLALQLHEAVRIKAGAVEIGSTDSLTACPGHTASSSSSFDWRCRPSDSVRGATHQSGR